MRVSLRLCALAAIVIGGTRAVQAGSIYAQTNIVSDLSTEGAAIVDPNLKNPWGVSFSATSPFWVSTAGTNTAQLFSDAGGTPSQLGLTVTTPEAGTPKGGPTGQVSVPSGVSGFNIPAASGGTVQADFIFANQNGTISAWNPGSTAGMNSALTVVDNSAGTNHADYTGLALATTANGTFLYAANTASNAIEVYNTQFERTTLAGSFVDPNAISGNNAIFEGQITVNTGVTSPFGLWSLEFGNGVTGGADTLYFTAGIDGYADGLFGAINVVPEPASIVSASLALLGGSICCGYRCLRRRKAQPTSRIESD